METTNRLGRRAFVARVTAILGGAAAIAAAMPILGYLIRPALGGGKADRWIPAGSVEDYPEDQPVAFSFTTAKVQGWERSVESRTAFVVRRSGTELEAFSNVCTHLACRVRWNAESGEYVCPCHNARFGPHGEVLSGPAPRPLDRYETRIREGKVLLHYREG